jgi:hypothetical protein
MAIRSLGFGWRSCFKGSKSGAFELEGSRIRSAQALENLYLVAAVALLYSTTQGMAVQLAGLRQQVDPHWRRGISYLAHWAALAQRGSQQGTLIAHPDSTPSQRPTAVLRLWPS